MEALLPVFSPEPLATFRGQFLQNGSIQLAEVYGDRVVLRELIAGTKLLQPRIIHVDSLIHGAKQISGRMISSNTNGDSLILIIGKQPAEAAAFRFEWDDHSSAFETKRVCKGTGVKTLDCWHDGRIASWSYDTDLRLHRAPPRERGEPYNVVDRLASRRRSGEVYEVACLSESRFGVLLRPPQNTVPAVVSVYRVNDGPKKLEVEDMRVTIWGAQSADNGGCMRLIAVEDSLSFIVAHPGGLNIVFRDSERWQCLLPFRCQSDNQRILSAELINMISDRFELLVLVDGPELWLVEISLDRNRRSVEGKRVQIPLPSQTIDVKLLANDLVKVWIRDEHPLLCDVKFSADSDRKPFLQGFVRVALGFDFSKISLDRAFIHDGRLIIPGLGSMYWHIPTRAHGLVPNSDGVRKLWALTLDVVAISTASQTAALKWKPHEKEYEPVVLPWLIQDEATVYVDNTIQVTASKLNINGTHLEFDEDSYAVHAIRNGQYMFIVTPRKLLKLDVSDHGKPIVSREIKTMQTVNMLSIYRGLLFLACYSTIGLYNKDTLIERNHPISYRGSVITGLQGNIVALSDGTIRTVGHGTKREIANCGAGPVRLFEIHDSVIIAVGSERSFIIGMAKGSFYPVPVTGIQGVTALARLNRLECAVVQNDLKVFLFKNAIPNLETSRSYPDAELVSVENSSAEFFQLRGRYLSVGVTLRETLEFTNDINGIIVGNYTLLDESMDIVLLVEGKNVHAIRADSLEVCSTVELDARCLGIHWIFQGDVAAVVTELSVIFLKTAPSLSGRLSISISHRLNFNVMNDSERRIVASGASDGRLAVKLTPNFPQEKYMVQFLWVAPPLRPRSAPEHEGYVRVVTTTCFEHESEDILQIAHIHSHVFVTTLLHNFTQLNVVSSRYTGDHQDMHEEGEVYEVPIDDFPVSREEVLRMADLRSPLDSKPVFKGYEILSKDPIAIHTEEAVVGTTWSMLRGLHVAWVRQLHKARSIVTDFEPHALILSPVSGVNLLAGGVGTSAERKSLTSWASSTEVNRYFRLAGDIIGRYRNEDTRELGVLLDGRLVDGIDDMTPPLGEISIPMETENGLKAVAEQADAGNELEIRKVAESLSNDNDVLEQFGLRNPGLSSSFLEGKIGRLTLQCLCD